MPDPSRDLAALQDAIRQFCEARDWDRFHGAKDLAIGVATEAGELLEHFRFRSDTEVEALFRDAAARSEIAAEMADVLIFLLRMAQRYEIDLGRAVVEKLAANEKRYPVETARGSNRKAE
jgi:NTP pyrophosphatase (non-canonical NTP hydrolase)